MRSLFLSLVLAPAFWASASAGEVVLFDAATDAKAVRAQDGATFRIADGILRVETRPSAGYPGVTVSGKWDLSACDQVEVEFVDGGIWGPYTLRLLNTGGSPHGKGCYISKLPVKGEKRIVCSQPLPVSLPNWGEVLAKLTRVRERRLHVAPKAAKLAEFPEAELLRMNAEAAALLKFARDEKTEACLKSVMVSCAKEMRDRKN